MNKSFLRFTQPASVACALLIGTLAFTQPGRAESSAGRMADKASAGASRLADKASAAASSAVDQASAAVSRMGQSSYNGMPDGQHWEHTHRASKIIGTDVRNKRGEKVGDVKDIVLDSHGTIAYAIVATGGFLGIGDRLHAVPWTALDTRGSKDYLIDIDKASLQKAPSFTSRDWPNFADETWLSNNRRFYHDWNPTTTTTP